MPAYLWSHLRLRVLGRGARPRINGRVWFRGAGSLVFGKGVVLDGTSCPIELCVEAGARLEIGEGTVISSGSSIEATSAVVLGRGCRIGPYCKILDNHWHPLRGDPFQRPPASPVLVGDGVVLESRVILLPGARIGDHVTVQARSVVSRAFPPDVVVCGHPARIVGRREASV
jgi:acetyltransferase-like isoleucine patch superfamily enzyme